ncbi:GTPase Der [Trichinella spiralis]|uniref:GTPase Der n=1 Tax=Trichinella spiralis TaxID=6334 RepID=A0ABR3L191_TRISP
MITPSVKGSSSAATGVAGLTCTVACKNRQLPETNADQKDDNKTAVAAERKSNIHRRNIPSSTMGRRQN